MGVPVNCDGAPRARVPLDGSGDGYEAVRRIAEALADAGYPRTSSFAGGEWTGWTTSEGATGFSLRESGASVVVSLVVSGREVGLLYRERTEYVEGSGEMTFADPLDADRLVPLIARVLATVGLDVRSGRVSGWQTHWDDDVSYEFVVDPSSIRRS